MHAFGTSLAFLAFFIFFFFFELELEELLPLSASANLADVSSACFGESGFQLNLDDTWIVLSSATSVQLRLLEELATAAMRVDCLETCKKQVTCPKVLTRCCCVQDIEIVRAFTIVFVWIFTQ